MARTLLSIMLGLLFSAALVAQTQRLVSIELRSGKIVQGAFKDADDEWVLLIVAEGEMRIRRDHIKKIVPIPVAKAEPKKNLPVAGSEPEVGQPGWNLEKITALGVTEEPIPPMPASPGGAARVDPASPLPSPTQVPMSPAGTDAQVGRLLDRYLWIIPRSSGNRISLGAVIFLILILMVQLSSKMANLERRSLARSGLMAICLFVICAIEIGITPVELPFLAGIALVDLVLWYLLTTLVFSVGASSSTVMLVSFALSSMVGVLCLEVMGFVLQEGALP